MATTTLKPYGGPGPAYGTIAGKAPAADGPHNPGAITTLWAWGGPGGRRTFADKAPAEVVTVTPTTPSGGWVYDPYRRRRRRDDADEPPPSVPVSVPDVPAVDLAALDARITALGEQIQRSRRGRAKMREQLRALEVERAIQIGLERRLRMLRDDDEWFLLS